MLFAGGATYVLEARDVGDGSIQIPQAVMAKAIGYNEFSGRDQEF